MPVAPSLCVLELRSGELRGSAAGSPCEFPLSEDEFSGQIGEGSIEAVESKKKLHRDNDLHR